MHAVADRPAGTTKKRVQISARATDAKTHALQGQLRRHPARSPTFMPEDPEKFMIEGLTRKPFPVFPAGLLGEHDIDITAVDRMATFTDGEQNSWSFSPGRIPMNFRSTLGHSQRYPHLQLDARQAAPRIRTGRSKSQYGQR